MQFGPFCGGSSLAQDANPKLKKTEKNRQGGPVPLCGLVFISGRGIVSRIEGGGVRWTGA